MGGREEGAIAKINLTGTSANFSVSKTKVPGPSCGGTAALGSTRKLETIREWSPNERLITIK